MPPVSGVYQSTYNSTYVPGTPRAYSPRKPMNPNLQASQIFGPPPSTGSRTPRQGSPRRLDPLASPRVGSPRKLSNRRASQISTPRTPQLPHGECICTLCHCGKHRCVHQVSTHHYDPSSLESEYHSRYPVPPPGHAKSAKPTTSKLDPLPFAGGSTMKSDYPGWRAVPLEKVKPANNGSLLESGPFQGTSAYRADFIEKASPRVPMIKPVDSEMRSGAKFEGQTTNRSDFNSYPGCYNPQAKVSHSQKHVEPGLPFHGLSTNKRDFTPKEGPVPNPVKPRESQATFKWGVADEWGSENKSAFHAHPLTECRSASLMPKAPKIKCVVDHRLG